MSNVILAALGMIVTMIAFAAFSIVQLAKTEAEAGRLYQDADASLRAPHGDPSGSSSGSATGSLAA